MSYNKLIVSGNLLELYNYEQEPNERLGRQNTRVKGRLADQFTSVEFPNYRDNPLFITQQKVRRSDNARHASLAFRRLVSANLRDNENPVFCSLTFKQEFTDVRDTARFFNLFTKRMRRVFGDEIRYVAVPEFQKSGRVHYHALYWGLPVDIASRERKDRKIANLWAQGFVDIIDTDGSPKLATYMAKYMSKAMRDPKLWAHKSYFGSQNLLRPKVSRGFPEWWVNDQYDLDKLLPDYESEFSTVWLGQAKYKRYNVS